MPLLLPLVVVTVASGGFFLARLREFWENVQPFIPRLRFFFFLSLSFQVEIRSRTLIPLHEPGSVHSGSAS